MNPADLLKAVQNSGLGHDVGAMFNGLGTTVHNDVAMPIQQATSAAGNAINSGLSTGMQDVGSTLSQIPTSFLPGPASLAAPLAPTIGNLFHDLNPVGQAIGNLNQGYQQNFERPVGQAVSNLINSPAGAFASRQVLGPLGQPIAQAGLGMALDLPSSLMRGAQDVTSEQARQNIIQGDLGTKLGALGDVSTLFGAGKAISDAAPFVAKVGGNLVNVTKDMWADPAFQNSLKSEQGFFSIDSPAVKMVPTDNLVIDEKDVDPQKVKQYQSTLPSGMPVPPVTAVKNGDNYEILDGAHQAQAARNLNYPFVPVVEAKPETKESISSWFNNERGGINPSAKVTNPLSNSQPTPEEPLLSELLGANTKQEDPFIQGLKNEQTAPPDMTDSRMKILEQQDPGVMARNAKINALEEGNLGPSMAQNGRFKGPVVTRLPKEGLRDDYQTVFNKLMSGTPEDYGVGRSVSKLVEGRQAAGKSLGNILEKQITKDLPEATDRETLRDFMDHSITASEVSPKIKEVASQLQAIEDAALGIRQHASFGFNPLENHIARYPLNEIRMPGGKPLPKALKTFSGNSLHRQILKFTNEKTGTEQIGTADMLGLSKIRGKGLNTIYEDANGQTFKASQAKVTDIENQGIQQYEKDAGKIMNRYVADTFKVKENQGVIDAFLTSPKYQDLAIPRDSGRDIPGDYRETTVRGLEGIMLDPKLARAVESLAPRIKDDPMALQMLDRIESVATHSIYYNFLTHPLNILTQTLIGSGEAGGPLGALRLAGNLPYAMKTVSEKGADLIKYQENGATLGGFANRSKGLLEKLATKVTNDPEVGKLVGNVNKLNPVSGVYKLNNAIVGASDDTLRVALYKTLEDSGMSTKEAVAKADKYLVDYGNTSKFEKQVTSRFIMFYPYLKGLAGSVGAIGRSPGALVNAALLMSTLIVAEKAFQQSTGNPDATVRYPGVLGLAKDVADIPSQLSQGEMPSLISSRLGRPVSREVLEQLANHDIYTNKPIYNNLTQGYNGTPPPTEAQARIRHVINALGPGRTIAAGTSGKKSVGEIGLNQLGLSTPHLQGYQAIPNQQNSLASLVNQPGAKNGTGLTAYKEKQDIVNKLSPVDQQNLTALNSLNLSYDPNNPAQYYQNKMERASFLLSNPNVLQAKTQIAQEEAKNNGTPLDPIYALKPQDQKTILRYESLPYGATKTAMYKADMPLISSYGQAMGDYMAQSSFSGTPAPQAPVPTSYVQAQMNAKNWRDPQVQQYLNADAAYKNQINTLLGLPPASTSGSGSASSSSRKSAFKRAMLRNMDTTMSQAKEASDKVSEMLQAKPAAADFSRPGQSGSNKFRPQSGSKFRPQSSVHSLLSTSHIPAVSLKSHTEYLRMAKQGAKRH